MEMLPKASYKCLFVPY